MCNKDILQPFSTKQIDTVFILSYNEVSGAVITHLRKSV